MKGKFPPIYGLWLLITVAMVIFLGFSLSEWEIKIGEYTAKKAGFAETLLSEPENTEIPASNVEVSDSIDSLVEKPIAEPDTTVHSMLVFGDSMTHLLSMSIAKYGTKNNYKVTSVTWESSSIPAWRKSGKIKDYIEMSKPDFIIVSLGSNEMELKHFDRRIPDVKEIVKQLDTIPFVWVGPPLWKEDRGVYSMLESALPHGVLFRTEGIEIPRGGDHIHPTKRGADIWADTIMSWISHSSHPILTERPDTGTSTRGHKFIYLNPDGHEKGKTATTQTPKAEEEKDELSGKAMEAEPKVKTEEPEKVEEEAIGQ